MNRASLLPLALAAVLALQGCTALQSARYAVSRYCALPEPARAANREAVAVALAPNGIEIHCAGGDR